MVCWFLLYLFIFLDLYCFFEALAPKFFKAKRWRLSSAEITSMGHAPAPAAADAAAPAPPPAGPQQSLADEMAAMRKQVCTCVHVRAHVWSPCAHLCCFVSICLRSELGCASATPTCTQLGNLASAGKSGTPTGCYRPVAASGGTIRGCASYSSPGLLVQLERIEALLRAQSVIAPQPQH